LEDDYFGTQCKPQLARVMTQIITHKFHVEAVSNWLTTAKTRQQGKDMLKKKRQCAPTSTHVH
jgi:hypothetical protein